MGNSDEYRFNDYNRDGNILERELTETDLGSIMGLFKQNDNPTSRSRHFYKEMATANKKGKNNIRN